jgi:hypothetical protein
MQTQEIQNILTDQTFIGIYPSIVSQVTCKNIIDEVEKYLQSDTEKLYGVEQFNQKGLARLDTQFFAERTLPDVAETISKGLKEAIDKYYEHYFILDPLKLISSVVKIQKTYPRGGYHVWHCEQDIIDHADRVLAWTMYLNDIPDGEGETEFLWQGVRITPKAGTICIFPAAFTHTHRGNPVYSCNKYIATGWFTHIPHAN